jgi:hypothetical protein
MYQGDEKGEYIQQFSDFLGNASQDKDSKGEEVIDSIDAVGILKYYANEILGDSPDWDKEIFTSSK